jgi:hypothetical protein
MDTHDRRRQADRQTGRQADRQTHTQAKTLSTVNEPGVGAQKPAPIGARKRVKGARGTSYIVRDPIRAGKEISIILSHSHNHTHIIQHTAHTHIRTHHTATCAGPDSAAKWTARNACIRTHRSHSQ